MSAAAGDYSSLDPSILFPDIPPFGVVMNLLFFRTGAKLIRSLVTTSFRLPYRPDGSHNSGLFTFQPPIGQATRHQIRPEMLEGVKVAEELYEPLMGGPPFRLSRWTGARTHPIAPFYPLR